MPFIDTKVTLPLTEEKKEAIKAKYGQAISVMNKTETYLMVGFEDNYDLYFGGNKLDKVAFVSVKVFGAAQPAACSEMSDPRRGARDPRGQDLCHLPGPL